MYEWVSKERLAKHRPKIKIPTGLRIEDHIKIGETERGNDGRLRTVAEFIGTDNFSSEWYNRQRFEVDAGRDEEPILYTPLYDIIEDASLPRQITINKLGPAGVVLEEIQEGGEVKFMTVAGSQATVTILHYGVGLQYTKDLFIFNELWRLAPIERQVGIAYNALLNHIHFNPIIAFSYTSDNQTAGNSAGSTLVENYANTIEDAITNSKADTTNPRRGPYYLLIASGDSFNVDKALKRRLQDGIDVQSSSVPQIRGVIEYDGAVLTRGNKTTTYTGVTAGTGYLVSTQYSNQDMQSYVKQALDSAMGNPDVSRFILEQVVYDTYLGAYCNPAGAVEEITWPTS